MSESNNNNSIRENINRRRSSLLTGVDDIILNKDDINHFERDNGDYIMRNDAEVLNGLMEETDLLPSDKEEMETGSINAKLQSPSPNTSLPIQPPAHAPRNNTSDTSSVQSTANSLESYGPEKEQQQGSDLENDAGSSLPQLVKKGTHYFSPKMQSQRKKVVLEFIRINFVLMLFIFIIFTIFWGSTYRTTPYYHKVNLLAVIQEDVITPEMANVTLPMTAPIPSIIEQVPGNWHVFNTSEFADRHNVEPWDQEKIDNAIFDLIYSETFWVAISIKPNATASLYQSLTNPTAPPFNSTEHFELIYESGRDPSNLKSVILPLGLAVETAFQEYFRQDYLPSMVQNISLADLNVVNLAKAGSMTWNEIDYRPFYDRMLMTVTQIGCVYCLILTVFQFLIYSPLHAEMSKMLRYKSRVIYRIVIAFLTHFFLSLFFCTVTAMYQVDFTRAFGRGGFMVYWMSTWMFMWAVGGINENMVSIIFALAPQYLGFWILGFVALNLCTTFFPLVLNNAFYRFGYMMPVHNLVDIYRVIFLNTSTWKMGRNYGILAGWIVLNTMLLPFFMKASSKLIVRRMKKQAAADAAAKN